MQKFETRFVLRQPGRNVSGTVEDPVLQSEDGRWVRACFTIKSPALTANHNFHS